jgi:hypothetical protein
MTYLTNLLYLIIYVTPIGIFLLILSIYLLYHLLLLLYNIIININRSKCTLTLTFKNANDEEFLIPLDYNISNLILNISYITIYIMFGIIGIIILRISRIFKEVDLYQVVIFYQDTSKLFSFLITMTVILIIINIILLWHIILLFFYKELKKLHIYLQQFGDYIHLKTSKDKLQCFLYKYFKIRKYSLYGLNDILGYILDSDLITTKHLPRFLQFIPRFLWTSQYSNYKIIIFIIYFFRQIEAGWVTLVKIIPYLLLFIVSIYDVITYNGILKHIYQVLLFIFIYRTWHNIAYFCYRKSCSTIDRALCVYYYKINDLVDKNILNKHYDYWQNLKYNFNFYGEKRYNEQLIQYIYCDLDIEFLRIQYLNLDPYRHISDFGKWFVKKRDNILKLMFIVYVQEKVKRILTYGK